MMNKRRIRIAVATAAGAAAVVGGLGFSTVASAVPATPATSATGSVTVPAGFTATVFAHAGAKVSSPDEITELDGKVFVGYQNGVGTKGEPSTTGQTASTVVEYNEHGKEVAHWNLKGRVDGLGADSRHHRVIATVNMDGNSSVYTVAPNGEHGVKHYHYSSLPHGGGTASVSVHDGAVYVVASNPKPGKDGATAGLPGMYKVTFSGHTAKTTPVFDDGVNVTQSWGKNAGQPFPLNLRSQDFGTFVPAQVPNVGGDLMVSTGAANETTNEVLFIHHLGQADQSAHIALQLSPGDDAFATTSSGTLYAVDGANNDVVAITGHFTPGEAFASTSGGLGTLNMKSDFLFPASFSNVMSKGLMFVPSDVDHAGQ
ncbi:hypothetical protein [Streptomyces gibsoniae]|uniref:Uncharacterized protein n=1 Tax=Streptomyces gibsoniae TaxID=3075529 RepID=A0ABU2TTR5_9ACTN|nr:hypothetical protein [Streptomyces sp. DSM 41699]MDT0464343.1 hypothetical protein [Streptomyces sp. DSM 41699]